MADNRNFAALEWVIGEIDETLKQARQSLEAYVENPQDSTRIRFCLTHIHQVHGSLQMVEFYGAALLAEEMEAIAHALMNGVVSNPAEAYEVLMRAILQLPIYLEQVKAKRNDDPGSLLPILNDLRAARGSTLLSESQFFNPDITAARLVSGKRNPAQANPAQFKAIVEKLRQMYQYAAAGVIRGVKIEENLDYLQKTFSRLHTLTSGTGRQRLWDIALAVVEGLNNEHIEISVSLKTLLRQLDKEIRLLSEHGVKALNSFTRDELIKNLLYYVARSEGTSPRIERLRKEFALDSALPAQLPVTGDNPLYAGPDPETMRTVVAALQDELGTIKQALDESLSGEDASILHEALPVMKRVADTLAVLGVVELRKQMLAQTEQLDGALTQHSVGHELLNSVADGIMSVEQSLALLANASGYGGASRSTQQMHINEAQETVLREARNGLEQTKDAIIEYIASQWDRSHLVGVPQQLEEIRGGLAMIPLARPAAIIKGCGRYIEAELLGKNETPEWNSLDTLADAIASVEYFLERLSGDREDDDDALLTLAEESINALGYGVAVFAPTHEAATKAPVDAATVLQKLVNVENVDIDALPAGVDEGDAAALPVIDEPAMAADPFALRTTAEIGSDQPQSPFAQDTAADTAAIQGEAVETPAVELSSAEPTQSEPSYFESSHSESSHSESRHFDGTDTPTEEQLAADPSRELESTNDQPTQELLTQQQTADEQSTEEQSAEEQPVDALVVTGSVTVGADHDSIDDAGGADDDEDEVDEEILEIFIEEAGEVLETIDEFFPQWAADFDDTAALIEFRRGFHTLKGSGRMVGAKDLGELAWSVENMLNRVLDGSVAAHPVQVELITRVRALLPEFIHAFEHQQPNPQPQQAAQLMVWAEAVSRGAQPQALLSPADVVDASAANSSDVVAEPQTDVEDEDDNGEGNAILWEIFGSEAITHLQVLENFILEMKASAPLFTPPSEGMQRALHTLKGSAHMADVHDVAELATPLERFAKELRTYQVNIDQDILQLFEDGAAYTHEALTQIRDGGTASIAKLGQFQARVAELRDLFVVPLIRQQEQREEKAIDPKLLSIFMAEEMNLLLDADVIIAQWRQTPENPDKLDLLITELNTLAKGAEHAHLPPMSAVSRQLAAIYAASHGILDAVTEDDFDTLLAAHEQLLDMVDAVAAGQNLQEPDPELELKLQTLQRKLESAAVDLAPQSGVAGWVTTGWDADYALVDIVVDERSEELTSFGSDELEPEPGDAVVTSAEGTETTDDGGLSSDVAEEFLAAVAELAEAEFVEPEFVEADLTTTEASAVDGVAEVIELTAAEPPAGEDPDELEFFAPEATFAGIDERAEIVEIGDVEAFAVTGESAAAGDPTEAESSFAAELSAPEGTLADVDEPVEVIEITEADASAVAAQYAEAEESAATEETFAIEFSAPVETWADDATPAEAVVFAEVETCADAEDLGEVEVVVAAEAFADGGAPEDFPTPVAPLQLPSAVTEAYPADGDDDDDIDPEIIEIFLEEADELMEDIEQAVHDWSEDWERRDCSEELQRALHTLKGGARLSGMTALGNVAHDFETVVINLSAPNADFFTRINGYQDQLLQGVAAVKAGMSGEVSLAEALTAELADVAPLAATGSTDDALLAETDIAAEFDLAATNADAVNLATVAEATAADSFSPDRSSRDSYRQAGATQAEEDDIADAGTWEGELVNAESTEEEVRNDFAPTPATSLGQVVPFTPKDGVPVVTGSSYELPPSRSVSRMGGGTVASPMQVKRNAPQEVVKVSAELLEELVNLAGETSISRGRMEEQISELGFAIEEMDSTISRLQEQLRRLDIETEAQILFRQEQLAELEDFDPLEMDRYSQLQQLSRSLIESASDLMDLKATLADKTRDTETLLLQQARINTDLQEGLMRSRMVPFSRLVPRLRRIVRQVSSELDKRVNFELDNVEGELDRTVLERMVAPLEHMLRNAVDHGIESPRERVAAGKSESGRIVLTVGREGSDVILRLIDDGRGINLKRVREKAIERGLMSAEAKLSDREVMQFILHAGFSTAQSVTQISGRGVGMDVVHSEIKQLGGAVIINSREGEGTEFIIRLPFTVSVNRALMVRIGDDRYAIPLNTIEGIVRVSPFELEHYYQNADARFEYAGEQYKVHYLGAMLSSDARPKLEGQAMPLPVVLVRSAQQAVAMQVDMLMGSREVVVKSLGLQFATVAGVSGATVMGDGSVVVILDPHAMIRQTAALAHDMTTLLEPAETVPQVQAKTVLVVDDSVTVRKVTSRFLEREGYEVLTAKDGADAMQQLQERIPDVMLLDIEMPRMDGFEVAKNVRSSSRLKHIPIIMITSRTGDKHRERAFSLGVNRYMGKPYQEDKLLHNILVVTGELVEMDNKSQQADVSPQE